MDIQATSQMYWTAALVTAALDLLLVGLLVWRLEESTFRQLQPGLTIAAMLFWCILYTWASWSFWEVCYAYLLPGWVRWFVVPFGLISGLLGYAFWWLSLRLPGKPLYWFFLLAGMHSLPGHLHAIYGRVMLERCPILAEVSASSALIFGIFEFILYWCFVLLISVLVRNLYLKHRRAPKKEI